MSKINVLRTLGFLFVSAACLMACSPEEYGPCTIPNTKAHTVACSPMGDAKTATCAVDYVFDCDSLVCGIYQSSEPFCTHRCVPKDSECVSDKAFCKCPEGETCKSECPEGAACVEWIKGSAAYYCLPADKGKAVTSSSSSDKNSSSSSAKEDDAE